MKKYHFIILIFLALSLGGYQLYIDYMDLHHPTEVKQVRVIYESEYDND